MSWVLQARTTNHTVTISAMGYMEKDQRMQAADLDKVLHRRVGWLLRVRGQTERALGLLPAAQQQLAHRHFHAHIQRLLTAPHQSKQSSTGSLSHRGCFAVNKPGCSVSHPGPHQATMGEVLSSAPSTEGVLTGNGTTRYGLPKFQKWLKSELPLPFQSSCAHRTNHLK